MSEFVSVDRINALKSGIESKTGETYADLTAGVQALVDGYGVGSAPVLTDLEITENGEYTPPDGVDGFGKVTANVAGSGGIKMATGSFTLESTSPLAPELTHNLGTKRIIVIVYLSNEDVITPTAGYLSIVATYINVPELIGIDSYQIDVTSYNPKFTGVVTQSLDELAFGATLRSPWATQSEFKTPNVSECAINKCTITDNSIRLMLSGSKFIGGLTYNYVVYGV